MPQPDAVLALSLWIAILRYTQSGIGNARMDRQSYRRDIDGLRGISILCVVACHAGVPGFAGGYTGVDVFFVISGYLITGVLLRSPMDGAAILDFYYRRARRLLPALLAMLSAVAGAAYWILAPSELVALGEALLATLAFSSNLYFWSVSGYFGPAAQEQPLLHTWSLGVEEQFYLLFPAALLVFRFGNLRKYLALALAAGAVISLGLAQYEVNKPATAAFFLLPTRAWQILAGALLAATRLHGRRWAATAFPLGPAFPVGIALIGLPVLLFDDTTPFPGWSAAPTVLGAVLLLLAGADRTSVAHRVLGHRLLVGPGRVSYSLYLWHWPLLILPAIWLARPLGGVERGLACALAAVLAVLSYRFVEQPFLKESVLHSRRARALLGLIAALLLAGAAGAFVALEGMPGRVPAAVRLAEADARSPWRLMAQPCKREVLPFAPSWCVFARPRPSRGLVVVWGDSHAEQFGMVTAADLLPLGYTVALASYGSCPPLPGQRIAIGRAGSERSAACNRFNLETEAALLRASPRLRLVVLAARWTPYLPTATSRADRWLATPDGGRSDLQAAAGTMQAGLERSVRGLGSRGVPVLIIDQAASFRRSPPVCARRTLMRGGSLEACGEAAGLPEIRTALRALILRASQEHGLARAFHPADALCRDGRCSPVAGGRLLYRDTNHLGVAGARYFMPRLLPVLKDALARSNTTLEQGPTRLDLAHFVQEVIATDAL